MKRLALIAALSGCTVGAGSSYIGQWRPRTAPKFVACLEDESGKCTQEKRVDEHVPERTFWGYMVVFPSVGVAITERDGETGVHARFELANELVRGRGKFAWGVRASVLLDVSSSIGFNGTGTVYYSLTERLALRAGLGFSPYTVEAGAMSAGEVQERAFVAGRALAGMQLAFAKTRSEGFLVLSVDVDRMYVAFDDPLQVTGIVGNIGIFF